MSKLIKKYAYRFFSVIAGLTLLTAFGCSTVGNTNDSVLLKQKSLL